MDTHSSIILRLDFLVYAKKVAIEVRNGKTKNLDKHTII